MPRRSRTDQELGFLRLAWDEVEDMERQHGCAVVVTLSATTQKGVFVGRASAMRLDDTSDGTPRTDVIQQRFPTGTHQSLGGWLWDLLRRLNDLVDASEEARRQAEQR